MDTTTSSIISGLCITPISCVLNLGLTVLMVMAGMRLMQKIRGKR